MNTLCRFCLDVSDSEMCSLHESDILHKIDITLKVDLSTEDFLPKLICKGCVLKIEEIHTFCSNIKQNQTKLLQYYQHGSLQNLLKLSNIKTEVTDDSTMFMLDSKEKNKDTEINDIKKNINSNEAIKNDIKEEIITEDHQETVFSSDDEILSIKKKNKENHTNKEAKATKVKSQNRRKINTETIDINPNIIKPTCLMCLKVYETQLELIKHYNEEHLKQQKNSSDIKYTEKEIDANIMYECNVCKINCSKKKEILTHVTVHDDDRPLICKLCGRTYKTVTEIIRHSRAHNGSKLHCSYKCGYTTAYQGALKEHENRHRDEYKYRCEKCSKGFHVKTWYEQHQNIHNGVKPFVCQICGLAFHMARYLTAHKSLMHPQSSSAKRYICVHCSQKCDSANSLALHLEVHGINKEKEFLCDFCGKILSSAENLKYHHRMHSGEKPYSCSICNKSFAKKFNVKIHMASHTGEKTHACAHCGKRYSQRSTLLRHQKRNHTGSSPTRNG